MPQDSLENLAFLQTSGVYVEDDKEEDGRTPADYRRTIRRLVLILALQFVITLAIISIGSVFLVKEWKKKSEPFAQTLYCKPFFSSEMSNLTLTKTHHSLENSACAACN